MFLLGCARPTDSQHRFPDFLESPGESEDAVGLCRPARGLMRYSQPPVVTSCVENAVEMNVIGWQGSSLLMLRSSSGVTHVRTPAELSAAIAPITSASMAVGYLFAAWHWQPGRLVDVRHDGESLVIPDTFEDNPPIVRAEDDGFTIEWPMIQMPPGGCQQDLYMVATHIGRDGSMQEPTKRLVTEALTRICY